MSKDDSTYATHPGRIRLDLATYLTCFPRALIFGAIVMPLGIAALIVGEQTGSFSPMIGISVILAGGVPGIYVNYVIGQWMMDGDTCPALVLDPSSGLIVVLAEMSTRPPDLFPALKVTHVPLARSPSKPFREYQRITTVCTFRGPIEALEWEDVIPIPVVCATKDSIAIQRSLQTLSAEKWTELEAAVETLASRQPGLYSLSQKGGD
jgi:Protein of unknown function (DUF3239)